MQVQTKEVNVVQPTGPIADRFSMTCTASSERRAIRSFWPENVPRKLVRSRSWSEIIRSGVTTPCMMISKQQDKHPEAAVVSFGSAGDRPVTHQIILRSSKAACIPQNSLRNRLFTLFGVWKRDWLRCFAVLSMNMSLNVGWNTPKWELERGEWWPSNFGRCWLFKFQGNQFGGGPHPNYKIMTWWTLHP